MCFDPASIIGIIGSIAQFSQQSSLAKRNEENALQAYRNEQQQLTLRQIQEDQAAKQKMQETNIEAAQKEAEVEVSAVGSNLAGISVGNIIGDVKRRALRAKTNQQRNLEMTVTQLEMEKKASRAQAQSRVNSVPRPSPLTLLAGVAGDLFSGFNADRRRKAFELPA